MLVIVTPHLPLLHGSARDTLHVYSTSALLFVNNGLCEMINLTLKRHSAPL